MVGPPLKRIRVTVRCYAELNDFLAPGRRHVAFVHECAPRTSVKDLVEALGVPHTEVELLLVGGEPAAFERRLQDGDRVAVYPVFEAFDVAGLSLVRPTPLRQVRFVLDVHLGRLARWLRLAGFDTEYRRAASDAELAAIARAERRILLTRDLGLLKRGEVSHGCFVRAERPEEQLAEVCSRLQLGRLVRPFSRCTVCNTLLEEATDEVVAARVPPASRAHFSRFLHCSGCGRVYWEGSHYQRLRLLIERACGLGGS